MGVLTLDGLARSIAAVAAMTGAAACYDPDYRDCLATCSSDDSCGPGQICGSDGLCASPAIAGRCADVAADAGGGAIDARPAPPPPVDAEPPPPDAAVAHLRVLVSGKGRVVADAFGIECTGGGNDDVGDCTFSVPLRAAVTLVPVEIHHDWFFDRWEGTECDRGACTVVVEPPTTIVGATFRRGDRDDD